MMTTVRTVRCAEVERKLLIRGSIVGYLRGLANIGVVSITGGSELETLMSIGGGGVHEVLDQEPV